MKHRLLIVIVLLAGLLCSCAPNAQGGLSLPDFTQGFQRPSQPSSAGVSLLRDAAPADVLVYRAVWVSYLEWPLLQTASADAFTQSVAALLDNCADTGINCVILQVRPFGDAIYQSSIFPWSHVITGAQGADPGYDPLAIFIREAHARSIAVEAWVNPYRVRLNEKTPAALSENNPALLHPEWVRAVSNGLYYDPGIPEVRQMVIDGVLEIVNGYDIDGIQFDDYFYMATEPDFDAQTYAQYGAGKPLADWRRDNVNTLLKDVYAAIKAAKPHVVFGVSPAGNNDNNYNYYFADVALWMANKGYVDYIMPQLYWGYGHTVSGAQRFAFENITQEWAAMPRDASVKLCYGIPTWYLGTGVDGQSNVEQWQTGHLMADMVSTMAATQGVSGFALYRYEQLFENKTYAELTQTERVNLRAQFVNSP